MEIAAVGHGRSTRPVERIPFYTLRTFLDAEYSVIMSYGFLVMAEKIVLLRTFLRQLYIDYPNNIGGIIGKVIEDTPFHEECATILFMVVLFVILVDDYYRARIITFLAPCRSIQRFALDVIIGFFLGLAFLLISVKSSLVWSAVGMAFLLGAAWANIVEIESHDWEKNPDGGDDRVRAKVSNWPLYRRRLKYVICSHVLFGSFMIGVNGLIILKDLTKEYYTLHAFLFLLCYLVCETGRFVAETRIIAKDGSEDDPDSMLGALKTIAWIPRIIKKLLELIAKMKLEPNR